MGEETYLCLGRDDEFFGENQFTWQGLDSFLEKHSGSFIVTLLSYDVKNHIENLQSKNGLKIATPKLVCYVPKSVYKIEGQNFEFWEYLGGHTLTLT
jgi:hypothetical protein